MLSYIHVSLMLSYIHGSFMLSYVSLMLRSPVTAMEALNVHRDASGRLTLTVHLIPVNIHQHDPPPGTDTFNSLNYKQVSENVTLTYLLKTIY